MQLLQALAGAANAYALCLVGVAALVFCGCRVVLLFIYILLALLLLLFVCIFACLYAATC